MSKTATPAFQQEVVGRIVTEAESQQSTNSCRAGTTESRSASWHSKLLHDSVRRELTQSRGAISATGRSIVAHPQRSKNIWLLPPERSSITLSILSAVATLSSRAPRAAVRPRLTVEMRRRPAKIGCRACPFCGAGARGPRERGHPGRSYGGFAGQFPRAHVFRYAHACTGPGDEEKMNPCPQCGAIPQASDKFCNICGTPVSPPA